MDIKKCAVLSLEWLAAAGIRAIKTGAQTLVAVIGTNVLFSDVNWAACFSAAGMAMLLSLLTSLGGLPELTLASEKKAALEAAKDEK